jgi:Reverse transcriptase-like
MHAVDTPHRPTHAAALLFGLEAALALEFRVRTPIASLCVLGDSELVIRQMLAEYAVRSPGLAGAHKRAMAAAAHFQCTWEHVLRNENAAADALANDALDGPAAGERQEWLCEQRSLHGNYSVSCHHASVSVLIECFRMHSDKAWVAAEHATKRQRLNTHIYGAQPGIA